jgi:hypothetical protein
MFVFRARVMKGMRFAVGNHQKLLRSSFLDIGPSLG